MKRIGSVDSKYFLGYQVAPCRLSLLKVQSDGFELQKSGSGTIPRVRVPKKSGFGGFWLTDNITIDGFGSGLGTISRVRVRFRYQKSRFSSTRTHH